MNKRIYAFIVLVIILVGAYFLYQRFFVVSKSKIEVFDGDVTVIMGEDGYQPQDFQIKKGSKVTFVNNSSSLRWPASDLHPSHLVFSEFDPKEPVAKDAKWEFQFNKVGEWGYHDHLAPYITGIIKVVE